MSGWLAREAKSFRHAIEGIGWTLRSERHMQIHCAATIVVIALAIWLKVTVSEWLWLLAAVTLVWVLELVNTAIERTVDLASPGDHPLAKAAKDSAAGAVLVASLFAVVVGIIILGPPLWNVCFQ